MSNFASDPLPLAINWPMAFLGSPKYLRARFALMIATFDFTSWSCSVNILPAANGMFMVVK